MIPLDDGTQSRVRRLSPRQHMALIYLAKGFTVLEIGDLMQVSGSTVADYVKAIYKTLQVDNKAEAAVIACKCGLV